MSDELVDSFTGPRQVEGVLLGGEKFLYGVMKTF